MESKSTLENLLRPNDYAVSYDLTEAYYNAPVHPALFCWEYNIWECVAHAVDFRGLNDLLRVFIQIMKKCIMVIREIYRVKYVIYLDNLLLLHPNKNHLKKITPQITKFLQYFGWIVSLKKCGH
jgi:hypothetical protein